VVMNDKKNGIGEGFRFARGSIRLILLRFVTAIVTGLPATLTAYNGVKDAVAQKPYYTEITGRMPTIHLVRFFQELPSTIVPIAFVSIVLGLIADQMLTAGAITVFDPNKKSEGSTSVLSTVGREGLTHLYPFLRIFVVGALLCVLGAAGVQKIVHSVSLAREIQGHSIEERLVSLPLLGFVVTSLWFSLVGAFVLWCRLFTVADGRRCVRRTALLVFSAWRRMPLRGPLFATALLFVAALLPGIVPIAWRLSSPATGGGVGRWVVVWFFVMLLQAWAWHVLVRAGRFLLEAPALAELRARPDDGFRLFGRIWGLVRKPAVVVAKPEA